MVRVLCHGAFDLLHPGHIQHLKEARALGQELIVSLTADAYVQKGPGHPVFGEQERIEMLEALRLVDKVVLVHDFTALPAIYEYQPDIYCKGSEYRQTDRIGNLATEVEAVKSYGGQIAFTEGPANSSTELINRWLSPFSEKVQTYLAECRQSFNAQEVLKYIDQCAELIPDLIGEFILDEYVFVEPQGRSAKENYIAFKRDKVEQYEGGIYAIGNHVRQLCPSLSLPEKPGHPLIKRRYISEPFFVKLFSEIEISDISHGEFIDYKHFRIVGDFGHGLIPNSQVASNIANHSSYLALTVQTNSANWGFNLVTKWPRADYLVIDDIELRLAMQKQHESIEKMDIYGWIQNHHVKNMMLTLGHRGLRFYGESGFCHAAPALSTKILDRMGAGDAVLGWTAPLAAIGAPPEIITFVGACAGAIKVGILGNKPVEKETIKQWIISLLK